jgi:hypothetical protein
VTNGSDRGAWGFCSEECKGEKTDPNSKYNLARNAEADVWNENFFDLRALGNGHCYT